VLREVLSAACPVRRPQDDGGEPEYGTMVWAMCTALKLAAPRVLFTEVIKKQFLQVQMALIHWIR